VPAVVNAVLEDVQIEIETGEARFDPSASTNA
jgi:hypothetical protein